MLTLFKQAALLGDVWVLWLLVAASVLSVAVMVDRFLAFRRGRLDFPAFYAEWERCLDAGDAAGARRIAHRHDAVEARVALAGLDGAVKGAESAVEGMSARLVLEKQRLERRLNILGTLGNNAPFVGLFGTVLGIIKAFNDLSAGGNTGVSAAMTGISSALIATAFGILVAIPAVVANNYFHTRLQNISGNAQALIHKVRDFLLDERRAADRPLALR